MAEGFLINEVKFSKNALIGISVITCSYIPYLIFKDRFEIYVIIVSIMVAIGIGFFGKAIMLEDNYKTLKKEALIFDEKVLKDINEKYNNIKNKYSTLIVFGVCLICLGRTISLLLKKVLAIEIDNTVYPVICTFSVSLGILWQDILFLLLKLMRY